MQRSAGVDRDWLALAAAALAAGPLGSNGRMLLIAIQDRTPFGGTANRRTAESRTAEPSKLRHNPREKGSGAFSGTPNVPIGLGNNVKPTGLWVRDDRKRLLTPFPGPDSVAGKARAAVRYSAVLRFAVSGPPAPRSLLRGEPLRRAGFRSHGPAVYNLPATRPTRSAYPPGRRD